MIEELFKTYMDDGFLPWHSTLDLNVLKNVLTNLHLTIKFTTELARFHNFSKALAINFLDITVLLHQNGYVETVIFYNETNTHDYLNYIVIIRTTQNIIFTSIRQNVFYYLCQMSKN